MGRDIYGFCYAKGRELIDISAFGDPVEQNGMKLVKVPFTYKKTGIADWLESYPFKKAYESSTSFDTVTLQLTNEGWKIIPRQ